jgi:5-methylcytosine-specific restriction endonuclease McrA
VSRFTSQELDAPAPAEPASTESPAPTPEVDAAPHEPRVGPAKCALDLPVLVVNRWFQPVQITSARRAFLLLYGGSALAIDERGDLHDFSGWRALPVRENDDEVSIVGGALRVPRVLHLRRYERMRRPTIRLTRKNLMLRDGHTCQYCARKPGVRDLNIDHVTPRSRGGEDTWENLVTACKPCNLRKGWRTPDEAAMRLLKKPAAPRWSTSTQILLGAPQPFEEWDPFLKTG